MVFASMIRSLSPPTSSLDGAVWSREMKADRSTAQHRLPCVKFPLSRSGAGRRSTGDVDHVTGQLRWGQARQ